jgi:hypothetical protein
MSRLYIDRDSSVGITTRYIPEGLGIESQLRVIFSAHDQRGSGAHPGSYTMHNVSLSQGVNQTGLPHLVLRLKK